MIDSNFHHLLHQERLRRKFSFRDLQSVTNIDKARLWRLEKGQVPPTRQERQLLNGALRTYGNELLFREHSPEKLYQIFRDRGRRWLGNPSPYWPKADRTSRIRFKAAQRSYPFEVGYLENRIRGRNDFAEVNAFCQGLALDSALECLFVLLLLSVGNEPAFVPPSALSPRLPWDVVDPETRSSVGHRPYPCLVAESRVHFFQVALLTPRLYVVDVLSWSKGRWSVVEIDGSGHRGTADYERSRALKLPVTRLCEKELLGLIAHPDNESSPRDIDQELAAVFKPSQRSCELLGAELRAPESRTRNSPARS